MVTSPEHPDGTPARPPDAGASALELAAQLELDIECIRSQLTGMVAALQELRRRRAQFRAGAAGEQHAVQALLDTLHDGWSLLADRRWPATRNANLDILLVGPGGVIVADVKRWREVHIAAGRLHRGQEPADDQVEGVAAQAHAVQDVLVDAGLAPGEVIPMMILDGVDLRPTTLTSVHGQVEALGERHLAGYLLRRAARLNPDQIATVLTTLDAACPPAARRRPPRHLSATATPPTTLTPPTTATPPTATAPGTSGAEQRQPPLLDTADVLRALVDAAAAEPIEAWMTWLHPSQAQLVTRRWNGPARIRGAAGTGKTVVALHRARHLATHGRRVLFTSYVTTLSPVFQALFARLAPDLTHRVEFTSVHKAAMRLLHHAGQPVHVDQSAITTCHARAWAAVRRDSPLADLGLPAGYWQDEIAHVIKGRGITDAATYAALPRPGRRTPLGATHRAAVWQLYEHYERLRTEKGLVDWDDVLLLAREALARGAVTSPWDAVIVDEAQDLTGAGLRLLHTLVGDRPDGLLLVGDGQQALYPGGVPLTETGISVVGRSTVLDINYRNTPAVLNEALSLLATDPLADPADEDPDHRPDSNHGVTVMRRGGTVVRGQAGDPSTQQRELLSHLAALHADGVRYGDIAVLVQTNAAAHQWIRRLNDAGLPTMPLTHYTGIREEAVKVGTFERAKALEFAHVLIPDSNLIPGPRHPTEPDDVYAERSARARNRLYVGYTRPRDGLWLGITTTTGTSHYPQPVG